MQKSAISWTTRSWNYIHGCSKVSDGCNHCYAMELSLARGWTPKPWTLQNESVNVLQKPHKLVEVYSADIEPGDRIFVNSMSDMFHRAIPDWYKAVGWSLMLDRSDLTFQVLTKRPEATIDWPERFNAAIRSDEFAAFTNKQKGRRGRWATVYENLYSMRLRGATGEHVNPWASHIWMGTSVEDHRVLSRIDALRQSEAAVKFISAEPLLGPWPADTDLTGIDWVIVGGESGTHMEPDSDRWMKQAWARGIRDLCLNQGVAYFYKQDSAKRTEVRTALEHEDGYHYIWQQYPGDLAEPIAATPSGKPRSNPPVAQVVHQRQYAERVIRQRVRYNANHEAPYAPDYDMPWEAYSLPEYGTITPRGAAPRKPRTIAIHTAQMGVDDPDALDITIKSATTVVGKLLQPGWDIVMSHKRGELTDEGYTARYKQMIRERYAIGSNAEIIHDWLRQTNRVTLKCYCADGAFCHRHIAADILQAVAENNEITVIRGGELKRQPKRTVTVQHRLL